jgi:hypothetical protein
MTCHPWRTLDYDVTEGLLYKISQVNFSVLKQRGLRGMQAGVKRIGNDCRQQFD